MSAPLHIAILGSTGSIGRQALDVVRAHPEKVRVTALAANASADLLIAQAREFGVAAIALGDEKAMRYAQSLIEPGDPFDGIGGGADAVADLVESDDVDLVLNALVGAAGLSVTVRCLRSGTRLALANKESLVVGGELVMALPGAEAIIPVDSEHSAIFQCLMGEQSSCVSRLWLTASGGPFFGRMRDELESVDAAAALAHPTWAMGPKITIDSSTLMNKGLEVIEAHHLFGVAYDDIAVLVQRQSRIHSMVEFADGSVIAHLGVTDMRVPIQYAFSYPGRWAAPAPPIDFRTSDPLDFGSPDTETFRCLRLAFEAGRAGGSAPVVLNAANEIAVAAFIAGRCGFLDIERVVESTLQSFPHEPVSGFDHLWDIDTDARRMAETVLLGLQ